MPKLIPYNGHFPVIDDSVFLCEGVVVIGDVVIGRDSSVWFNSVIRGDGVSSELENARIFRTIPRCMLLTTRVRFILGTM